MCCEGTVLVDKAGAERIYGPDQCLRYFPGTSNIPSDATLADMKRPLFKSSECAVCFEVQKWGAWCYMRSTLCPRGRIR